MALVGDIPCSRFWLSGLVANKIREVTNKMGLAANKTKNLQIKPVNLSSQQKGPPKRVFYLLKMLNFIYFVLKIALLEPKNTLKQKNT